MYGMKSQPYTTAPQNLRINSRSITSLETRALTPRNFAPKLGASPMVVPWGYFSDVKNHKPPTFSRKIRGLRFQNVAVKERFELSIQFLVYTLSRRAP